MRGFANGAEEFDPNDMSEEEWDELAVEEQRAAPERHARQEAARSQALLDDARWAERQLLPVNAFDCEDIKVLADDGTVIFSGPKHLRCKREECRLLVTKGMIKAYGGCWCGNRRLIPAMRLTKVEAERLQQGYYPLATWEAALIQPAIPADKVAGWGKADWEQQYA